jgi:hypothetical protein
MNPSGIREKLFHLYSENLRLLQEKLNLSVGSLNGDLITEIHSAIYICPFCCNGFHKDTLEQTFPNPLTLEDLPPKSVGGKPQILTCKSCNNTGGYRMDKAIKEYFILEQFSKRNPSAELKVKLSFNESNRVKATTYFKDDKTLAVKFQTKNNPYAGRKFEEMRTAWDQSKFNLGFQNYNPTVGLIRIGYLLAFKYLGNAILLDGNSVKIREQLQNPETLRLPHTSIIELPDDLGDKVGLHFVVKPKEIMSFLVVFQIKENRMKKQFGVFIPAPGKLGWDNYSTIQNFTNPSEIEFVELTHYNFLQNEHYVDGYFTLPDYYFNS